MKIILKKNIRIFFVSLLFIFAYMISNPLRWPEAIIKTKLLLDNPLGTSMTEVSSYIKKKGWAIRHVDEKQGFFFQKKPCDLNNGAKLVRNMFGYDDCIVGSKSIRASLGNYWAIFITNVTVFWGFNEEEKLIDVWVWKTNDAP